MKYIVFDFNSVFIKYFLVNNVNLFDIKRSILLKIIGFVNYLKIDDKKSIILAVDGKGSWRKRYFSSYKERKKIDDEKYLLFYNFVEELSLYTKFKVICIDEVEADDICAVFSHLYGKDVYILSNDKDMFQLSKYANVYKEEKNDLFSFYFKYEYDENLVKLSFLKGDTSDNIKSAVSHKFTKKFVNEILSVGIENYILLDKEIEEKYNFNRKLMCLDKDCIDSDIYSKICSKINEVLNRDDVSYEVMANFFRKYGIGG